jgi:membrane protease YdiL (CAAX protease family)
MRKVLEMFAQRRSVIIEVVLFFILFMIAHTCEVYIKEYTALRDYYVLGLLVRLLIWTLPVVLLTLKQNSLRYLKLDKNIVRGVMIGLIAGLVLFALRSLIIYFMHGSIKMNLSIPVGTWLNVILFVGLSEEVVFRGYLLQKIESISTFWTANLISAFLFFIMHLPVFFIVRHVGAFELLNEFRSMMMMGLLLGYLFKKSNSLWPCLIVHSINNFMCTVIN